MQKKIILSISMAIFVFVLVITGTAVCDDIKKHIDQIDTKIKAAGFKGVNKQYGIGRFLYSAMQGKIALESGLNYAFWTELSERDKTVDNKWRLSQVVDNYEIYRIIEYASGELVTLTIAIPASTQMTIEGQVLKDGFYIFLGNFDFTSITGVATPIQGFKPVSIVFKD